MRVFLSWSGDLSREVAKAFDGFLKRVIQDTQPWVSAGGIPSGGIWFSEIMGKLSDAKIGVLFVTQENKQSPWLMFEAGAIAKGLDENRVCALLIDCKSEDIKAPLAQFQHTPLRKDGILELLRTINAGLDDKRLADDVLIDSMEAHWAKFEDAVSKLFENQPIPTKQERSDRELLVEVLETLRALDRTRHLTNSAILEALSNPAQRLAALTGTQGFEAGLLDSGQSMPLSAILNLAKYDNRTRDPDTGALVVRLTGDSPSALSGGIGKVETPDPTKK